MPLAVLGRTRRYPLARIARLSGLAGVAHVLVSIVLGAVVIAVGLQFRSAIEHDQSTIIGCILIATGIGFLALELTGHGQHHHDHSDDEHEHAPAHASRRVSGLASVMVPFGAAASPDLTILPVFLAASTVGVATAVATLVVFAAVTIATITCMTLVAARGGYQIRGEWLERWGNAFTAAVLAVIGPLVLLQVV